MQLIPILILAVGLAVPGYPSAQAEQERQKPLYYQLSPSIVVNLQKGGKYARCDVQLLTHGEERLETLELHAPALRNEFLFMIPEFDGAELKTPKGKERLRRRALEASRQVMKKLTGEAVVDGVYFTAFYVQ